MLCPNCKKQMQNIMHYEYKKSYQFYKCSNCNYETKHKRIHYKEESEELDAEEIISNNQRRLHS